MDVSCHIHHKMTNLDSDEEEGGHLVGVKTLVVDLLGAACSSSLSDEMTIWPRRSFQEYPFFQVRSTLTSSARLLKPTWHAGLHKRVMQFMPLKRTQLVENSIISNIVHSRFTATLTKLLSLVPRTTELTLPRDDCSLSSVSEASFT